MFPKKWEPPLVAAAKDGIWGAKSWRYDAKDYFLMALALLLIIVLKVVRVVFYQVSRLLSKFELIVLIVFLLAVM